MVFDRSRANDEEAASSPQCRFSAIEPLGRLTGLVPATTGCPTSIGSSLVATTSPDRRHASIIQTSLDQDEQLPEKIAEQQERGISWTETAGEQSVLYLAYGSNLASKTFLGDRGIQPLSQLSVLVPELRLTFDLPGIPYAEPCFAGTQFRNTSSTLNEGAGSEDELSVVNDDDYISEKAALLVETVETRRSEYSGRNWHKPLVGVVYEVTLADYAKIIATEGGGRGYRDVVVNCHAFAENYKSTDPVPDHPTTPSFKAHTLLSPAADESRKRAQGIQPHIHRPSLSLLSDVGPHMRPDPDYAQPSARYLNLIVTGAEEHDLPVSYREYLSRIHSYKTTTMRQQIGKVVFLAAWGPVILLLLILGRICAGPDGRSPPWLVGFANLVFGALWNSYDYIFKPVFGDGERTINDTQSI
ncbi:uncharacterized protein N7459_004507 [Penicillium hispanicum]|uniref:uncharacterized protein n=1 Tax=Penicillium hispanicum TaxID=1080232 RepID=UPI00253FC525|nr:uncharacterized protein N7459_004507 [Penicillium hispanicum]KAJ5584707.1 hypothetical protein N7459_004507 [Penicillium hispanicum]